MSGAILFIGKFLLGAVLFVLLLVSVLNLFMRITICYEIRQDPFFQYNPEESFDEWFAHKKLCRDPLKLLFASALPVFLGYSIYSLIRTKVKEKDD
ncbi:MAG: hypothetical protein Q7R91_01410 [bacterium]|nr:hypothetical protein [bacterium]